MARAAGPEVKPAFEDLPKLDIHVHFFEDIPGLAEKLRSLNMQVVSICTRGNNPEYLRMMQEMSELLDGKAHDVFRYASTFDLTQRNVPGYDVTV